MRKLKKALSLTLALALSLALAVPAFAVGTTETVINEDWGIIITFHNLLRKETIMVQGEPETVYVVEDNSQIEITAASGRKYLEEKYVNDVNTYWEFMYGPYWEHIDEYANRADVSRLFAVVRDGSLDFAGVGNAVEPLKGPVTITEIPYAQRSESDKADDKEIAEPGDDIICEINIRYGVKWLSETDFAKLSAYTSTQPSIPDITVENIPASGTAKASTQTVTVDGKPVEFQMYALVDANGNDTNYIKLRDMAYVLNDTSARFSVGYDSASNQISLATGQAYAASGSEMTTPYSGNRAYKGGAQTVMINGAEVAMTAITLTDDAGGDYNYFKLRDLGAALGFNVGYSNEQGVYIESNKPYQG